MRDQCARFVLQRGTGISGSYPECEFTANIRGASSLQEDGSSLMSFHERLCSRAFRRVWLCALLAGNIIVCSSAARPQTNANTPPPKDTPTADSPKDPLGRISPREAVLGFLSAARKGNSEVAVLYLNTSLRGESAQELSRQLAVVLDRRLPARLNELSDSPDGSLPDPLKPDEDIVGTIPAAKGDLDITLERVDRGKFGRVWLFSRKTLNLIPEVFDEVTTPAVERFLPKFLVTTRVADIPLFEYVAVFFGLPLLYFLTGLFDRVFGFGLGVILRLRKSRVKDPTILPQPVRLFVIAFTIRSMLSVVGLPLIARQFWSTVAAVVNIVGGVWL